MKTVAMVFIPQTLTLIGEYESEPVNDLGEGEQRYKLSNAYQAVMLNTQQGIAYQFIFLGDYEGFADDTVVVLNEKSVLYKQYLSVLSDIQIATEMPGNMSPLMRKPH